MTAAEATKSNMKMGEPGRLPSMAYAVFICNWRYNDPLRTYGEMVELGARIAEMCKAAGSSAIRSIPTARTRAEKEHLVYQQQAQGREGEVWFIPSIPYTAGKNTEDALIRTKYLTELTVRVMGYTQASNPAYAFGALCLESMDGKDLGQLGTGFSLDERQVLKDKFDECGPFSVEVRCQGWTSDEKLRHARFLKMVAVKGHPEPIVQLSLNDA
jgi:ATP-dependent DNA ligase